MQYDLNQFYNMSPKENSKAHKAKEANKREYERVVCAKCGKSNVTLYKTAFGTYECKDCKNSCELRQVDAEN